MEKINLTLDYSKWICGEGGPHQVGKGQVALLNRDGFMCCLGQWSLQLGCSEDLILGRGEPGEVGVEIPGLCYQGDREEHVIYYHDTKFSNDAIKINDDKNTTPEEKIKLLTDLCANNNFELEVINRQ